jgi:hypothetical protein
MSDGKPNPDPAPSLRQHGAAFAVFAALALLFTFPAVSELGVGAQLVAHFQRYDILMKYWDYWYVSQHVRDLRSFLWAMPIFHPIGAELAFHSWNLSHVVALIGLKPLVGLEGAFNLTAVLALLLNGYCSYLLALDLFGDRTAAVYGGFVAGFIPYNQFHMSSHPDMMMMMGIPLAIMFVRRAFLHDSWRSALGGGLSIGFVSLTGIYLFGVLVIILVPVGLYLFLSEGRFKRKRSWGIATILTLVSTVSLAPRLGPMLMRGGFGLGEALEKKQSRTIPDLFSYVVPRNHPWFPSGLLGFDTHPLVYVGIIPIGLALYALFNRAARRNVGLWAALAAGFVLLTLGNKAMVAGHDLGLPMLRPLLMRVMPIPFAAIIDPSYFMPGAGLLVGMTAAGGLAHIVSLHSAAGAYERWVMFFAGGLLALTAFEFWIGLPLPRPPPSQDSAFFTQIAAEPGDFAIVQLPMGRRPAKRYIYYQTIHHKAVAEGVVGRTPREAYAYIEGNELLRAWRHGTPLRCNEEQRQSFLNALHELQRDGFRYVTLERGERSRLRPYFTGIEPVYADAALEAWRIDSMLERPPCR